MVLHDISKEEINDLGRRNLLEIQSEAVLSKRSPPDDKSTDYESTKKRRHVEAVTDYNELK